MSDDRTPLWRMTDEQLRAYADDDLVPWDKRKTAAAILAERTFVPEPTFAPPTAADYLNRETKRRRLSMKLLTKQNLGALPPLYSQDGKGLDATVHVKFFGGGRWTWYVTEYDGDDTFFGYVLSGLGPDCDEFGYFSRAELEALRFPPLNLPIERDLHFTPRPVRECEGVNAK
jgi:hypothetical protein